MALYQLLLIKSTKIIISQPIVDQTEPNLKFSHNITLWTYHLIYSVLLYQSGKPLEGVPVYCQASRFIIIFLYLIIYYNNDPPPGTLPDDVAGCPEPPSSAAAAAAGVAPHLTATARRSSTPSAAEPCCKAEPRCTLVGAHADDRATDCGAPARCGCCSRRRSPRRA